MQEMMMMMMIFGAN